MIKPDSVERFVRENLHKTFPTCKIFVNGDFGENNNETFTMLMDLAKFSLFAIEGKAMGEIEEMPQKDRACMDNICDFTDIISSCEMMLSFMCPKCILQNLLDDNSIIIKINENWHESKIGGTEIIADFDQLKSFVAKLHYKFATNRENFAGFER